MDTNKNDIKEKIKQLIDKCRDEQVHLAIITDYFTQGINKNSAPLESLQILPFTKEKYPISWNLHSHPPPLSKKFKILAPRKLGGEQKSWKHSIWQKILRKISKK